MARTPQVVLDAIFRKPVSIAGLRMNPFSMAHFLYLEKLHHPLSKESIESLTGEQILQALVLLSLPGEIVLDLAEADLARRVREAAGKVAVADILGISQRLTEHVRSYFAVQPGRFTTVDDGGGADRPFAMRRRKAASVPAGRCANSRNPAARIRRACAASSRRRSIG